MKRTFIKMLPLVAAVLLATSCSKDSNDDSSVVIDNSVETQNVASPDNDGVTIVPLTITVNKDGNSLSKASVDIADGEGGKKTYTQKFIAGDVLVISNSEVLTSEATFTLRSGGEGKTSATFEGELSVKSDATLTKGTTQLNAVLKNTGSDEEKKNSGQPVSGVQPVSSLEQGFEKYGYLTADNFTYNGDETSIQLVQNTVFLHITLSSGTTTAIVNNTQYNADANSEIFLAVASGTEIESNLFSGKKTFTKDGGKVVKNINRTAKQPDAFTINSSGTQVYFSQGNLQYNADASPKWRFAENQYDICHTINSNDNVGDNYTNWKEDGQYKWTDLFGWGMWLDPTSFQGDNTNYASNINPSKTSNSTGQDYVSYTPEGGDTKTVYQSDLNELGTTYMGAGWRTLTTDEWSYLFNSRDKASDLYGWGSVNSVNGLILLPDGWTLPEGLSFTKGMSATTNSYTIEQWSAMQSAGAVFLPAAGYRSGSSVGAAGSFGRYWSSSASGAPYARGVGFNSGDLGPSDRRSRYLGFSVRLVRAL
ncbi:MAG: hypothetical protein J6U21_03640 [Bacteroidales bacterium]|nr:hypothetical protein [Bacteroidales bacterium]